MAGKSVAIIGAGIAGLAAGCYARMNGYEADIFELHNLPGGLCTAWKRDGYTFDGCLHWLVGSRQGGYFNDMWAELGALPGPGVVDHDEFTRVEGADGKQFILYTNLDRLERHMLELAPADAAVTKEFIGACRFFATHEMPPDPGPDGMGPLEMVKMVRYLPLVNKLRTYGRITVQEFGARFTDPFLREAFIRLFDLAGFPLVFMMITFAWMHLRDAGWPLGGSLEFARRIEQRYRALGGRLHYRARVAAILVENDQAVGVKLADGTEHRADHVISAADGHATIFDMLDGKYADETIRGYYREMPIFQPVTQVSLGVARDFSKEPQQVSFVLPEPLHVGGVETRYLGVKHYSYDPSMAPAGKSALVVYLEARYDYWKKLGEDRAAYEAEKQACAQAVIGALDRRWPGLAAQVETVDVATGLTTERYTGNWQGSMEGWLMTTENFNLTWSGGMKKMLPGLSNFYMAGQWVEPGGGVPTAALSGRNIVRLMCKHDGVRFAATRA